MRGGAPPDKLAEIKAAKNPVVAEPTGEVPPIYSSWSKLEAQQYNRISSKENWKAEPTGVVPSNIQGWINFKKGRKSKVEKII